MKIHVVSELSWLLRGNGVNTAFVQMVRLLRKGGDVEVVVNGQGRGDVYHAHSYGLFYFLRGIGYRGRRVLTVHVIPDSARGSIPGWQVLMPLLRKYFRLVYDYADVCLALSPTVEEAIRSLGSKTRIIRIYNPIPVEYWRSDPERKRQGRAMLRLNEDDFVVLGVGQLEGRKGVEDFLDMAEGVPEAKFVWAGGRPFGALTEGIARINSRLANASENVSFPGMFELDRMPLVYAAADLFVFPSYQENCPMAPLEAAAAGIPVIFRDLPEYRLLYRSPYMAAPGTPEFIKMIRNCMTDSSFRDDGVRLSGSLLRQFDESQIRSQLIGIYTDLLEKRTRR